jgi:hypothetical protein
LNIVWRVCYQSCPATIANEEFHYQRKSEAEKRREVLGQRCEVCFEPSALFKNLLGLHSGCKTLAS